VVRCSTLVRTTALHDWHVAQGAVFEDVGQWKRPRHYPLDGRAALESMDAAVLRECAATRTGVGILDGSTLGKIDVQGRDAPELLDRIYTNLMSSLKVGAVRYGVMCGVDGMVIDDGTVMRLAEDRFLVYTTTGGAAKILDWMEEWLQTEWPQLQVSLASVTDHLATFPVVGPRSRDVIGAVFGEVDVTNEAFPFMTWRETTLDGVPVRLARVSFSGELAYEVNVNWWHAPAVWDRLMAAGRPIRHHPVRHRDDARAARREGLPDHRAGHRRHRHPARSRHGLGGVEEEARLHRQALVQPARTRTVAQAARRAVAVDRLTPTSGGLTDRRVLLRRRAPAATGSDAGSRHVELPQRRARSHLRAGAGQGGPVPDRRDLHVPVDGTLVPVEVTGSVLVDPEGARRDG
jgi:sarcosine oxidase subunit alpha